MPSDGWVQLGLVLAGAGAGFTPAYLLDRARWQRETVKDWQGLRRTNVVRFLSLLSRLTHETIMLGEALGRQPLPGDPATYGLDDLPHEPAASRGRTIDGLRDEITGVLEELKLVSSDEHVRLGKAVLRELNRMTALAKRGMSLGDNDFVEARSALRLAKAEFRERVRHDLEVNSI